MPNGLDIPTVLKKVVAPALAIRRMAAGQ